jgi:DNA modification methylase
MTLGEIASLASSFTAGALVLDPFAGSGSTAVAAALFRRCYPAIALEAKYVRLAEKRLPGVARHLARSP